MNKKLLAGVAGVALLGGAYLMSGTDAQVEVPTKVYQKDTTTDSPTYDIPDVALCMYVSFSRENWIEKGEGKNVVEVYQTFFDGEKWLPEALMFKTDGGIRRDSKGNIFLENPWYGGIGEGRGRKVMIRVKALEDINSRLTVKFDLCDSYIPELQ